LLEEIAEPRRAAELKILAGWRRTAAAAGRAAPRKSSGLGARVLPVGSQLVVALAFVRVGEDLVGFVDLLEAVFGLFLVGAFGHVGMETARQFAKRRFDLLGRSRASDLQGFVIVFKFYSHR